MGKVELKLKINGLKRNIINQDEVEAFAPQKFKWLELYVIG